MAAAAPFLAIQGVFNYGVTGSVTKSPFAFYNERDQPALAFGGAGDLSRRPLSVVPQKQWFYDYFTLRFIRQAENDEGTLEHARKRIESIAITVTPSPWAVPLAAMGLLFVRTGRRAAVAALLGLYAVAYSRYAIYLFHYVTFALPALALAYGAAPRVAGWCVAARSRPAVEAGVAALLFGFVWADVMTQVPPPDVYDAFTVEDNNTRLKLARVPPPAVVLFKADPNMNLHLEAVYNDTVAWPDDAAIVRAHNLTDAIDRKLFAYYAARQPDRGVWLFDRRDGRLSPLGNVADLARRFPATRP